VWTGRPYGDRSSGVCAFEYQHPSSKREGVARGEMPEAPIPTAAGNVSANFSQRALLPTVATLLALGGSREVLLPGLFTSENEEPPLPSQAEILLRERTPAEVRERAKVAASKRQRRKAFLRLRRAARAEGRQHLEEHPRSLEAEVAASNRQRRMALLKSRRAARALGRQHQQHPEEHQQSEEGPEEGGMERCP
jgi:hypothetical protein